jgi:cytoplasmic iron level regulating protein YaaA (DUF328/UPF0246 family)
VPILLPPSEGKADAPSGAPADLAALAFAAELGAMRERIVKAADPSLFSAPAAPASEIYTGVLFAHLDLPSLSAAARRRAESEVLIASGMWGLLAPGDRIPTYKLPIGAKVKRIKTLAAAWRAPVAAALDGADMEGELFVDCRSGAYAAVWRPARATLLPVRALSVLPDGTRKPISHMAKASRGLAARAILSARGKIDSPERVAAACEAAGLEVELGETLDVIVR